MVVILLNELLHLADGVLSAIWHMLADVGDFRPDHHTVLVAQIIEVLVVLIVGKTHGIGTQFGNQRHILFVHLLCNGIAKPLPILMSGDTM